MKKIILSFFLITTLLFIFYYFGCKENNKIIETETCPVVIKEVLINGTSMEPFIKSGDTVSAIYDYYDCNDILRDDVVLYDYAGNKSLLIKSVKAIPGDRWELKEVNNGYEIVVNNESVLNFEKEPYLISSNSAKMIELYINDYPIIPNDTYLLLGNKIGGTLDSTKFGLVGKNDIKAKVQIVD